MEKVVEKVKTKVSKKDYKSGHTTRTGQNHLIATLEKELAIVRAERNAVCKELAEIKTRASNIAEGQFSMHLIAKDIESLGDKKFSRYDYLRAQVVIMQDVAKSILKGKGTFEGPVDLPTEK